MTSFKDIICFLGCSSGGRHLQKNKQCCKRDSVLRFGYHQRRWSWCGRKFKIFRKLQFRSSRNHRQFDWGRGFPCRWRHRHWETIQILKICFSAYLLLLHTNMTLMYQMACSLLTPVSSLYTTKSQTRTLLSPFWLLYWPFVTFSLLFLLGNFDLLFYFMSY